MKNKVLIIVLITTILSFVVYILSNQTKPIALGDYLTLYTNIDNDTGTEKNSALIIMDTEFKEEKSYQELKGNFTDIVILNANDSEEYEMPKYILLDEENRNKPALVTYDISTDKYNIQYNYKTNQKEEEKLKIIDNQTDYLLLKPSSYLEIKDAKQFREAEYYWLEDYEQLTLY